MIAGVATAEEACLPVVSLRDHLPRADATKSWRELSAGLARDHERLRNLSPAERVVVAYLNQGFSNREIAEALGKSVCTVKTQVSACLTKCGVRSRARLIALLR